jgi:HTH-type transcriptional regulator, sugar sensing transcriptional regulator
MTIVAVQRLWADLSALGFTEYEARVYLSLLKQSPATGYQISIACGVPRSMVYEALGRLDGRGAVLSSRSGRATLYRPLRPEVLLDRYEREHGQLIASLRAELAEFGEQPGPGLLWRIRGGEPVMAYMRSMIESSRSELFLVLPDAELDALRADLAQAAGRGVKLQTLLTGEADLALGEVARHPSRESELQQLTHIALIEKDREEALIADTSGEVSASVTGDENLVLIARQFVWMELLAQRLVARLGDELFDVLEPSARSLFRELQVREA